MTSINKLLLKLPTEIKMNQNRDDLPDVIVTIRVIRSFEHRNIRNLVIKGVDLDRTIQDFFPTVIAILKQRSDLPPPVRNYNYDTMKIQHQAYGAKTNDPIINTDDDQLILKNETTLRMGGVRHETEISLFNLNDYTKYRETKLTK